MRAQDLNIAELVQFSPGSVGLQGRRLLIHDLSALAQFRRDLIETVGEEMARRILTRKGFFWGQADAAGMQRLFEWDTTEEWLKAGPELAKISGMALVEIKITTLEETTGRFEVALNCSNSAEVEQHRSEMGTALKPVCWALVGYASGYMSYCLGKSIYFIEQSCQCKGDESCVLIGKDIDSWGATIEKDIPFFLATDIQKKVLELSKKIRSQQRALTLQKKKLIASRESVNLAQVAVRSKPFRNVLLLAERVAEFDTSVLITGETGTGKEVLARHIHASSKRKDCPFIAVNCSALPEPLLESELFGHRAGAFTGAHADQVGLFRAAESGTIFLDEIGDISPGLQAKLLRVLQSKEVRPVGETKTRIVDVRVVASTNRNLDQLVDEGKFRKDLLYRLSVVHIIVPPLRERVDDILPLARFFLDKFRRRHKIQNLRFSPATLDVLMNYQWPGNVRELENALEHAAVVCTDGVVTPDNLPSTITGTASPVATNDFNQPIKKMEGLHITRVLELTNGNRAESARILGISESTLYRRLKHLPLNAMLQ
jgi:DNA-binding NtrC family response regulator/predicted hydrocarbon binding protein